MKICTKSFDNEDIEKMVRNHLKINEEDEIVLEKVDIRFASEGLTGFQAEYFKMDATVSFRGKRTEVFFFIKSLPCDKEKAKKFTEAGYFHKEINIYNAIFPQFRKYQKFHNYMMPCLHSSHTDIVFEDLNKKGYAVTDARKTFDNQHCIVALKSLAQFHAASIILEETKKATIAYEYNIEDVFKDVLTKCGYSYDGWYIVCMKAALEAASESQKYGKNSEHYSQVKEKWSQVFRDAVALSKPSKTTRNVLCHRDLWANNLMFRSDDNNTPIHCIFVDFQVSLCMPPAADVVSLLYLNLLSCQRKESFNDLIRYYYMHLSQELDQHQINVETIFPWDLFKEDCEVFKKWGLIQCICLHQLGLMEPKYAQRLLHNPVDYERIINFTRNEEILYKVKNDPIYKQRYLDSVDDLIRLYIVKENLNI